MCNIWKWESISLVLCPLYLLYLHTLCFSSLYHHIWRRSHHPAGVCTIPSLYQNILIYGRARVERNQLWSHTNLIITSVSTQCPWVAAHVQGMQITALFDGRKNNGRGRISAFMFCSSEKRKVSIEGTEVVAVNLWQALKYRNYSKTVVQKTYNFVVLLWDYALIS